MKNLPAKTKKPELIILEEQTKIRDYEDDAVLNALLVELVNHLLALLGVSGKANSQDHIKAIQFIKDAMRNYTVEEIKKAFDMFVAGEFKEKPIHKFDAVVVGYVMREYQSHKDEKLRNYRLAQQKEDDHAPEKPTEQEQEEMMNNRIAELILEYQSRGTISGVLTHVYSHLRGKGLLPKHTPEYREKTMEKAKKIAKAEAGQEAMKSFAAQYKLKHTIQKIESGKYDSLRSICQRIAIIDYLKTL